MEVLHPKKVGRSVRPWETKEAALVGTGGKEYDLGNSAARSWVA